MLGFVVCSLWHLSAQPNLLVISVLKKLDHFLIARSINVRELLNQMEYMEKLKPLYLELQQHPNRLEFIVRKAAHVLVFAVSTMTVFFLVSSYLKRFCAALVISGLLTLMLAVVDEMHQSFVPGRAGRWFDVGVDCAGIILALVLLAFVKLIGKLNLEK
nr:VanZ family protein [Desulforadius tongensis]